MHEFPITEHIVKMAERTCREQGGKKVRLINLVMGEYSGYVPESVQMYFDIIQEGTLCEGAKVHITRIRPKLRCPECGELFEKAPMSFACPKCGADGEPTDIGKEFYIESIEIE